MQTAMNIWWRSQQKAGSLLCWWVQQQCVYLPLRRHAEPTVSCSGTAASMWGPWTPHASCKPLDLTTWISITERDRCVGGVQSFLIWALLLSVSEAAAQTSCVPCCACLHLCDWMYCMVYPLSQWHQGLQGSSWGYPQLLGGSGVCYDVLWRTCITRGPDTAGTMPVVSGDRPLEMCPYFLN